MFDALDADEGIRHLLDLSPFALHHQYLQTVVVVQMHVHTRQHQFMETVLDIGELLGERRHVMIVDERNRPHRLLILIPLLPDQIVANQIAERLRSIGILLPRNVPIEVVQQMMIKGDTEANKFFLVPANRVTNLKIVACSLTSSASGVNPRSSRTALRCSKLEEGAAGVSSYPPAGDSVEISDDIVKDMGWKDNTRVTLCVSHSYS